MGARKSRKAALKKRFRSRKRGGGGIHHGLNIREWAGFDAWLDNMSDLDKKILEKYGEDYTEHHKVRMTDKLEYKLKRTFYELILKWRKEQSEDRFYEGSYIKREIYEHKTPLFDAIKASRKLDFSY
jgi:hypothetical protein